MNKLTRISVFLLMTGSAATALAKPMDRIMDRLDTDEDGMISQDEFKPSDRGMIGRMDKDKDGAVTRDEMHQHIADRQAEMAKRQAEMISRFQAFFKAADADQDGKVSREEAQAAAFTRIDADGDGYLTANEMRDAKPPHQRRRHGGRHHGERMGGDSGDSES